MSSLWLQGKIHHTVDILGIFLNGLRLAGSDLFRVKIATLIKGDHLDFIKMLKIIAHTKCIDIILMAGTKYRFHLVKLSLFLYILSIFFTSLGARGSTHQAFMLVTRLPH
jgi:hypothetical protein